MKAQEVRRCYGKYYAKLDKCESCDVADYCNEAKDIAPIRHGVEFHDQFHYGSASADIIDAETVQYVLDLFEGIGDPTLAMKLVPVIFEFCKLAAEHPKTYEVVILRIMKPDVSKKQLGNWTGCAKSTAIYHLRRAAKSSTIIAGILYGLGEEYLHDPILFPESA